MKFFATILTAFILSFLFSFIKLFKSTFKTSSFINSNIGSQACLYWFLDEPKMPKSLLEK